jgi:hypothetical protein
MTGSRGRAACPGVVGEPSPTSVAPNDAGATTSQRRPPRHDQTEPAGCQRSGTRPESTTPERAIEAEGLLKV